MRIGFDAKRLYNNFTGLGNYSRTLLYNLAAYHNENEYHLYTPKIKTCAETEKILNSPDFFTHQYKGSYKAYWRTFAIKNNLINDNIDIYHGLSHELPLGIENTGIKRVVTMHDVIYKTFPKMFNVIDRMIYENKYSHSCKNADKIVAISESTKKDIIELLNVSPDKIEVVYQTINPTFYSMQTYEEALQRVAPYKIPKNFLLYIGTINNRKNLLSILKGYILLPKDLQIPLVIIGNGSSYKKEVIKFIISNNLTNNVILIDHVKETKTLQAFYQLADLFVFPSFYEGFGLPVTEALMCKTAVLTSNTSSLPEAGGNGALYVDPFSVDDIAHQMTNLLTNTDLRKELAEKGFNYAHTKFEQSILTEQMNKLYSNLIG